AEPGPDVVGTRRADHHRLHQGGCSASAARPDGQVAVGVDLHGVHILTHRPAQDALVRGKPGPAVLGHGRPDLLVHLRHSAGQLPHDHGHRHRLCQGRNDHRAQVGAGEQRTERRYRLGDHLPAGSAWRHEPLQVLGQSRDRVVARPQQPPAWRARQHRHELVCGRRHRRGPPLVMTADSRAGPDPSPWGPLPIADDRGTQLSRRTTSATATTPTSPRTGSTSTSWRAPACAARATRAAAAGPCSTVSTETAGSGVATALTAVVPRACAGTACQASAATSATGRPWSMTTTGGATPAGAAPVGPPAATVSSCATVAEASTATAARASGTRSSPRAPSCALACRTEACAPLHSTAPTTIAQIAVLIVGRWPWASGQPRETTTTVIASTCPARPATSIPRNRSFVVAQMAASSSLPPSIGSAGSR